MSAGPAGKKGDSWISGVPGPRGPSGDKGQAGNGGVTGMGLYRGAMTFSPIVRGHQDCLGLQDPRDPRETWL
ncbi:hypothetical protein AGOR_G00061250 [Albula goreensis]|uniref:Uncharacterized protein n=1 Tax=Albula goreensis TaxID=1534307 RepID=A0A8T3DVG7_9TELE|nr:hypothetical protein AGOR_G00061250 [Albula goreensis]